jgi:hypothetical protein
MRLAKGFTELAVPRGAPASAQVDGTPSGEIRQQGRHRGPVGVMLKLDVARLFGFPRPARAATIPRCVDDTGGR